MLRAKYMHEWASFKMFSHFLPHVAVQPEVKDLFFNRWTENWLGWRLMNVTVKATHRQPGGSTLREVNNGQNFQWRSVWSDRIRLRFRRLLTGRRERNKPEGNFLFSWEQHMSSTEQSDLCAPPDLWEFVPIVGFTKNPQIQTVICISNKIVDQR